MTSDFAEEARGRLYGRNNIFRFSCRVFEISDVEIILNDVVYLFYCYPSRGLHNSRKRDTREMHISGKRVYAASAVLQSLSLMYC